MFENADKVFPIFFGTWIILGILSFYLFFIKNDYQFKIKYYRFFVVLAGMIFIGFVAAMGAPKRIYIILIPAVALTMFLNIKFTRFCKTCGKTIINQIPFTSISFCPKCGSRLQDQS